MHHHDLTRPIRRVHVALFYRKFMAANSPYCHVGLGVNALHTVKVLRRHGISSHAQGVENVAAIEAYLNAHSETTHVVIEAIWVNTPAMLNLAGSYPEVNFLVRSHSQIGFLQVEPGAVKLIREQLVAQEGTINFRVAANSRRLGGFLQDAYAGSCLYLPNLYDAERPTRKRDERHDHRTLRISSFGALRLLKNHPTAAAAALLIARELGCDLEFWISVDRVEHGAGILSTLRNMFAGLPWAKLVENKWEPWEKFHRTARHMDLCLQPSFTETYNIVSVDSVCEGTPCVVGPSIEWAPRSWQVDVDDPGAIARVGSHLLSSHSAAAEGLKSFEAYQAESIKIWKEYLSGDGAALITI
jgi:hypothetical protein